VAVLTLVAAGLAGVPAAPAVSHAPSAGSAVATVTAVPVRGRAAWASGPWLRTAPGADGGDEAGEPPGAAADLPPGDGRHLSAWSPRSALPVAGAGEHVDVVLSPHPDDETLSLGVWIANAVARGDRVIVVALTDGRSTGAAGALGVRLRRPVTRDEIAAARLAELRDAAAQLGVRPDDVYPAHLDDEAGPDGTRATQAEVAAVIAAFAVRFPEATFATMSDTAERHPDHLDAGLALRAALVDGAVGHAAFAISRLRWGLPSPPVTEVMPASAAVRRRVLLAADAYGRWAPAEGRLAVGWTSVHQQFVALLADPRDRVHG